MKRKILQIILGILTKRIIKKYNPKVIAVTGSAGKTSAKNAIALFLENSFSVRKSIGNLNSEFGVPLVFIGKNKGGENSLLSWLKIILSGVKIIMFRVKDYPEIVVVEMGADKPGDISYLTEIAKPFIGVITLIGELPVHLSNYRDLEELVSEKSQIIKSLDNNGCAVLNFDDQKVRGIKKDNKAKVIYFGFNEGADIMVDNLSYCYEDNKPKGIKFDVNYENQKETIHLPSCLGNPFAYAVAVAVSCGLFLKLDFRGLSEIFRNLKPEKGRLNLIEGKNGSYIIDDTYNASPSSVKAALEVLSSLSAYRRIVVLGDMKELGAESEKAHKEIGEMVFGLADILITVGKEAERIEEKAVEIGFNDENTYHFQNSKEAVQEMRNVVKAGDLILVKGSRAMKMEEIVKVIAKNKNDY